MTRLRPAGTADLDAVVALEQRALGDRAWSRALLADELRAAPETRWFLVAETSGGVDEPPLAGYAVASYLGEVAEIHRVAVEEGQRRRGLGRRLVAGLVEQAERRGCRRVLLEVAADDDGALALYAGAGFLAIARRPRYYGGVTDALVMELALPGGDGSDERLGSGPAQ